MDDVRFDRQKSLLGLSHRYGRTKSVLQGLEPFPDRVEFGDCLASEFIQSFLARVMPDMMSGVLLYWIKLKFLNRTARSRHWPKVQL